LKFIQGDTFDRLAPVKKIVSLLFYLQDRSASHPTFDKRVWGVIQNEIRFNCVLEKYFQSSEEKGEAAG
jgi:hypothetical protein